ncbi:MAG: FixH family protein [Verrucomicrobiota bacterium]
MKTDRNFWPLGIIAAFVLLFAGIIVVIVIAATHRDTLVSENYYENELKYQGQIDSAARAKTSGATLAYDAAAGRIAVFIPVGQLGPNFSGNITLYRPSASGLDRQIRLAPGADGIQTLKISDLTPGPWLARAAWKSGGQDFYLETKFVAPK